jgi:hypothetical protein
MSKSFSVLLSGFCFLLGACSLWITTGAGDCSANIRVSVVTLVMVGLANWFLGFEDEKPSGIWLRIQQAGWILSGLLLFPMMGRVVTSFLGQSCPIGI